MYVVLVEDGYVSVNSEGDPEQFSTYHDAAGRAQVLAAQQPGVPVAIFKLAMRVLAPVGDIEFIPSDGWVGKD